MEPNGQRTDDDHLQAKEPPGGPPRGWVGGPGMLSVRRADRIGFSAYMTSTPTNAPSITHDADHIGDATEMVFTDTMLQDLKGHVAACGDCQTCSEMGLGRLLARLEAAEAYIEFRLHFPSGHDGEAIKLEAWRKAAGK